MIEIYETREEYEMAMRSGIGNNYILPMESNEEVKVLQEKLDIAVKALEYISKVTDNLEPYEELGLIFNCAETAQEALAKIKEKE